MAQLDDMDLVAVRIQHELRALNSQLQCLAGWCNLYTSGFLDSKSRWFRYKSRGVSIYRGAQLST